VRGVMLGEGERGWVGKEMLVRRDFREVGKGINGGMISVGSLPRFASPLSVRFNACGYV